MKAFAVIGLPAPNQACADPDSPRTITWLSHMSAISGCWTTTTIAGKTADVYEPSAPVEPACAVLHLHGHGLTTLRDNCVFSAELARCGLRAVCPHGQQSWWLDRVCTEFDTRTSPMRFLIDEVVPFMKRRWHGCPIGLVGISMGGQGVLQLAYRHAKDFPVVAAISPAIDFHQWYGQGLPLDQMFDNTEDARQATAILQIHPLNWPRRQLFVCDPADTDWFDGVDRLRMKLSSSGIPFEADLTTSRGGHGWQYFEHMAPKVIGFVAEHLRETGFGGG